MSDSVAPMEEAPKVKKDRPDSLKKPPRQSIFYEHHEMPPVWTRDSQSSYGGARSPTFTDNFETGSYISESPGHYGGFEPVDRSRQPTPHSIGYAYEMPDRYGGKGTAYGSEIAIPLTDNTWAPPVSQGKRWCGLGKIALVILLTLLCILIVGGGIGGVVAAVTAAKQSTKNSSKTNPTSLVSSAAQTETASSTSTMTLPNGSIVLTTLVITSTNRADSQTTTQMQSTTQSQSQLQTQTQTQSSTISTSTSSSLSSISSTISSTTFMSTSIIASPTPSSINGTMSA